MAENMDGSTVEGTPMSPKRLRTLRESALRAPVTTESCRMLELIREVERLRNEVPCWHCGGGGDVLASPSLTHPGRPMHASCAVIYDEDDSQS